MDPTASPPAQTSAGTGKEKESEHENSCFVEGFPLARPHEPVWFGVIRRPTTGGADEVHELESLSVSKGVEVEVEVGGGFVFDMPKDEEYSKAKT